jgi:hypothetical protein
METLPTIADRIAEFKITATFTMTDAPMPEDFDPDGYAYKVTVKSGVTGRQYSFPFFTGSLFGDPTTEDAVNALRTDASVYYDSSSYADYCDEFGVEETPDTRKTYNGCRQAYINACRFLGVEAAHALIMDTEGL